MNHHAMQELALPPHSGPERVAALLERYPEVSRDETREILTFLQTGRYLDVGALTGSRRLHQKLDAFLKDHWIHFHVRSGQGEAVVVAVGISLFVLWVIWAAFS